MGNLLRRHEFWVSVDLMYGLLDQTVDSVRRDLDVVLEARAVKMALSTLRLTEEGAVLVEAIINTEL